MAKTSEMIESKYLRKEDIDGDVIVTIQKIGQGNVALDDQPEQLKWMVKFAEFKKPMVLNSTNIQLLEKACGSDDTDDWIGKEVILFVDDNVSFGGKLVGGIRIRSARQTAAPKRPGKVQDMPDDLPWKDGRE